MEIDLLTFRWMEELDGLDVLSNCEVAAKINRIKEEGTQSLSDLSILKRTFR